MDTRLFNFIRPKEEILPRTIHNTTLQDVTNLLSLPISSYDVKVNPEDPHKLSVEHPRPYPLRYGQLIKSETRRLREETHQLRIDYADTRYDLSNLRHDYFLLNRDHTLLSRDHALLSRSYSLLNTDHALLRTDYNLLKQELNTQHQKMVDWETRSRIAQGLNDQLVPLVINDYALLKDGGFTYLPHILSVWAVKNGRHPASHLLGDLKLDQKEVDRMCHRAELLLSKGLGDVVDHVWNSVTPVDRNTMVTMYLTTRMHPRTSVAHPYPTGDEGRRVIEDDSHLSPEEKAVACGIIETAVDSNGTPLFYGS